MSKKVLEFKTQDEPLSRQFYPDGEIELAPLEGEWWNIEGKWDGIFSYYSLTKTPFPIEQDIINHWSDCLEADGLLHIFVPSWEFLCRMALQEMLQQWVKPMMLDAANQFTMRSLRILLNKAGLAVIKAKTGEGHIVKYDTEIVLEQHFVVGQKQ